MFRGLVSVFHVNKATLQIYLVQDIMRLLFAISLFICFTFCKGQTAIDSIINTTWVDDFNVKLQFGSDSILTRSGYRVNQPKFFINDKVIAYQYVSNTDWHQMRYEYYKDSLVLHSKDLDFLWFRDCYFGRDLKKNSGDHRWVYYSENYVKNKSLGFEKIQIIGNGFLEVDSAGNIFCNIINHDDLYGHYRGELLEQQLQEFLDLIEREQLRIKRLACSGSYGNRTIIRYRANSKTYAISHCFDDLRERGFETFDFILDNVDLEKLQFQNYADGDSVAGVVVFTPRLRYTDSHIYQAKPTLLGNYEDEGKKYYLYKCYIDSVCTPRDSFTLSNHSQKLLYFYSDTWLNTQKRMIIETDYVENYWFYRGRAFQRPPRLIFRKLISHKEFPENYKLVVRGGYRERELRGIPVYEGRENELFPNPFPKPYRTKFGVPYPFLRPPFQVAFEEYVLADWEEYLKNQKFQE